VPAPRDVVLDDRLLIEELLVGLRKSRRRVALHTTTYWYYRAGRAAALGAGGHLSGPFEQLAESLQQRAIVSLLELRDNIGLPDPRVVVPRMVDVAARHPRLNLLNLEAVAFAGVLPGTVWLSEESAGGVLPGVFESEGVRWETVAIE
jgi:hypothetical protein